MACICVRRNACHSSNFSIFDNWDWRLETIFLSRPRTGMWCVLHQVPSARNRSFPVSPPPLLSTHLPAASPPSSPQPAERRGGGGGRERFPPLSISHTARIPADKKEGPDVACRTLLPLLRKGFSFKKHPPVLFGILPQGPNCLLERVESGKIELPPPKKKVPGIPASISGRKSREKTNIGSGKVGPKHKQPKKERGRLEPKTSEEREREREREELREGGGESHKHQAGGDQPAKGFDKLSLADRIF